MRTLIGLTMLGAMAISASAATQDCALGARYLTLAKDRMAAFANDEALTFLRQATEVCPSYDAYEQLGELGAQSAQREDKAEAVKALVEAHARAPDATARARSLYQYAALLNREGDPQNAYPLIKEARTLDPGSHDIATLAGTIEAEQQHPTQEHIVRALRYSLFVPLAMAPVPGSTTATKGSGSGPSAPAAPAATASGPSVNIPVNFKTASIAVDELTQPNLELLAHALADPSLSDRQFRFVGHSDARGGEEFNVTLSKQRAEAIYHIVTALEPALKDRIAVEGHGAREPIDPGTDENALRANRRLQVLIK